MGQVSSRDPLPLFPRSAVPPPRPSSNLIPRSFQKLQGGQPPGLAGRRAGTPAGLARRCHVAWHPGVPSEMERWHPDVVRAPGCVCVGGSPTVPLLLPEGWGTFLTWFSASSMEMVLFKAHRFSVMVPSMCPQRVIPWFCGILNISAIPSPMFSALFGQHNR